MHEETTTAESGGATTSVNFQSVNNESKHSASQKVNTNDPFIGYATYKSKSILATAIIPVEHQDGTIVHLRTLLDQGSQSNLISELAVERLGLKKHPVNVSISSISESTTSIAKFKIALTMGSLYKAYTWTIININWKLS